MAEWADYQEEVAQFFRNLELEACTDVTLKGVRTSHDIDVVVRSNYAGFDLLWLVECKRWKRPVSKIHVLGFREIVSDLGADRGILMSESGYQKGALEAAQLTNVQISSLAALTLTTSDALGRARLRSIQRRVDKCRALYWRLSKDTRIKYGLREEWWKYGYSADEVMQAISGAIDSALRGQIPVIGLGPIEPMLLTQVYPQLGSAKTLRELMGYLEPLISDVEDRLKTAYSGIAQENRNDLNE